MCLKSAHQVRVKMAAQPLLENTERQAQDGYMTFLELMVVDQLKDEGVNLATVFQTTSNLRQECI